jgi:mannose-6-phosphate isomerase-like protein (cupin superfamily)
MRHAPIEGSSAMTQHTIKNLREVEDSAPKFGMEELMQARFAAGDLGLERSGVSLQRVAPDATQPFGHHHKGQEELYVIIDGSGKVKLDDEVFDVKALDAIRVAPEVTRAFSAGPDGLEFLAYGAPAVVEPMQDVVTEQNWWSDAKAGGARS